MKKSPQKINRIHANFSRNGLVEEVANKINELVDAINDIHDTNKVEKCVDADTPCPHKTIHTERVFDNIIKKTCADCGLYLGKVDVVYPKTNE